MSNQHLKAEDGAQTGVASDKRRSFLKGMASIPVFGALSSLVLPGRVAAAEGAEDAAPSGGVYNVTGHYFESCTCTTAVCPCLFLEEPTEGYCQDFPLWHIEQGHLGDVRLDGLNVAAWLHSPGKFIDGKWRLALYIDERATPEQFKAIEEMWTGQHGGYLQVIASLVSEYMGAKPAKITWKQDGKKSVMTVEGIGDLEMNAYEGPDGTAVTVRDTPLAIGPPHPITISKSTRWSYQDHGVDVLVSGTAGLGSAFKYSA